jgi:RNA polymerase sigma factor (sigma-70 family)
VVGTLAGRAEEREALVEILNRSVRVCCRRIQAYLRGRLNDVVEAEDLFQDFALFILKRPRALLIESDEHLVNLCLSFVKRRIWKLLQKRARFRAERLEDVLGDESCADRALCFEGTAIEEDERLALIRTLLEAVLSKGEAAAVHLRYFEDRKVAEISIELRLHESAVYKRIWRGLEKLRDHVQRHPELMQSLSA